MKIFILAMTFCLHSLASDLTVAGKWKTIDDDTGKPKSIVEVIETNGVVTGNVQSLFRTPAEDQNPKCDKCSGGKKDQLIIGMQIMKDLKKASDVKWSGGEILDPNNGKTYSCKIELIENGAKLKVRGFIGFSLLGRTQIWEKVP